MLTLAALVSLAALTGCSEEPCQGAGCNTGGGGGATGGGTGGGGTGGGGTGGGGSSGCAGGQEFIADAQTWSGTRAVACDVVVTGTLTVSAGTRVELAPGADITVAGSLVVEGTAAQRVTFAPATAGMPWGTLRIDPAVGGTRSASLKYATLSGGGGASGPVETSLVMASALYLAREDVVLDNVTVENAVGVGVVMDTVSLGAGSASLSVTGSGSFPLFLCPNRAGTVPAGSTFTSNGKSALLLSSAWLARHDCDERVVQDVTLKNLGAPWQLGTGARPAVIELSTVQSGQPDFGRTPPLLTIDPGVRLQVARNAAQAGQPGSSSIRVQNGVRSGMPEVPLGAVRAVGTAAQPIVFTSAEAAPAAGDWQGFMFKGGLDARTALDHVVIEYAGGESLSIAACVTRPSPPMGESDKDADAAIVITQAEGQPSRSLLTNSTIRDSRGNGVARMWFGTEVDHLATNTFERIGWCRQTPVATPQGSSTCTPMVCQ